MDRFTANGAEFELETVGRGEPLVLIHGSIIGDAFSPLLRQQTLTERARVTNYHRRGFLGSSRHSGPCSIKQQAADALAVVRQVAGGSAHLAGHSYGAATALQLAIDSPDSVLSLSLLEPPLAVPSAEAFFAGVPALAELYKAGNRQEAVNQFMTLVAGPGYRMAIDQTLGGSWFEQASDDLDAFFQTELPALNDWAFTAELAARIKQPVLSVVGADSHQFFQEGHALLQDWLPQTEAVVIATATHALQMQQPAAVAGALAGFLSRHPALATA